MSSDARLAEAGFTVVELGVCVTILSVLLLAGIPAVLELRASTERYDGKLQLESAIKRTRAEALSNGARALLRTSRDGESYSIGLDFLPYSSAPSEDTISSFENLPRGVSLALDRALIFNSAGTLIAPNGDAGSVRFSLSQDGHDFCSGTVFSTGLLDMSCGG